LSSACTKTIARDQAATSGSEAGRFGRHVAPRRCPMLAAFERPLSGLPDRLISTAASGKIARCVNYFTLALADRLQNQLHATHRFHNVE
jgi:hypothetical protein